MNKSTHTQTWMEMIECQVKALHYYYCLPNKIWILNCLAAAVAMTIQSKITFSTWKMLIKAQRAHHWKLFEWKMNLNGIVIRFSSIWIIFTQLRVRRQAYQLKFRHKNKYKGHCISFEREFRLLFFYYISIFVLKFNAANKNGEKVENVYYNDKASLLFVVWQQNEYLLLRKFGYVTVFSQLLFFRTQIQFQENLLKSQP